jgi:hypothetical protein
MADLPSFLARISVGLFTEVVIVRTGFLAAREECHRTIQQFLLRNQLARAVLLESASALSHRSG